MPLVRISVSPDVTLPQLQALGDAVHLAMVQTFNVPLADKFQVLTRHGAGELVCTPEFLGVSHGSRVAFVQITCAEGRSLDVKKALYADIAERAAATGAVQAADVVINLLEVKRENWSFGNGVAQYASQP
jgi:4-oxalocrotonate tautomerase